MIPEWVVEEMQTVDLGDARRDARLLVVPQPTWHRSRPSVCQPRSGADARRPKPSLASLKTTTSTSPTSRMVAAHEPADRHARASAARHHHVRPEMAERDFLSSPPARLPVGSPSLRDAGQRGALPRGGTGHLVANAVRDAEGSRVFRPELRGRVRGLGMEVGVPNHAEEAAAKDPADIARQGADGRPIGQPSTLNHDWHLARDGAHGRPIGRLREPLDRRDARRGNDLERTSTSARHGPLLGRLRPNP